MKKIVKENSKDIVIVAIVLLLISINIYNYIYDALYINFFPTKGINAFSFWYYVRVDNLGEILVFLSPLIVTILGISRLNNELNSGIYKDMILKMGYKKYFRRKIKYSYMNGGLFFSLISIVVFSIGLLLFSDKITIANNGINVLYLPEGLQSSPYLYVFLTIILNIIYSVTIINISLIVQLFVKKIYLILLISFVSINFTNYAVANIFILIANIIKRSDLLYSIENINIFGGYSPILSIGFAFISVSIWCIISFVFTYMFYHKRERILQFYD